MELDTFLTDATLEVFTSMIFIDIDPGPATAESVAVFDPNITSLIGLAGDMKGLLAIHCPEAVALAITSAMLGMDVTELAEDAKDAIGEIANMVAGGLKVAVAGEGKNIELAIPTTVIGKSIRTSGLSGATRIVIPFTCPMGRFCIELRFILA